MLPADDPGRRAAPGRGSTRRRRSARCWWRSRSEDADEAIAVANATGYGLSAGLITGDHQRGFALARRIDAGAVHVNDQTIADEPQLPLGGVKDSGWGRSGPESMADFTEVQWITTRDGAGHYPI